MLFGKKTRDSYQGIDREIFEFLEDADKAYIRAFETRDIRVLREYFTRDCIIRLTSVIAAEASTRYFSTDKFRSTRWTAKSKVRNLKEEIITICKEVTFRDINVAGSTRMKVSNDYSELWYLNVTAEDFYITKVSSIPD